MEQQPCPFCATPQPKHRYSVHGYRFVTCTACGLVYRVAMPEAVHAQQTLTAEPAQRLSGIQTQTGLSAGRLLDVGAGEGAFVARAETAGWEAWGVEAAAEKAKHAQQNALNVIQGTLTDGLFNTASFDVITCWGSLSAEPLTLVTRITSLLVADGWFVAHMPNIGALRAKVARKRWRWLAAGHPVYFDQTTLTALLTQSGLRVATFTTEGGDLMTAYAQKGPHA